MRVIRQLNLTAAVQAAFKNMSFLSNSSVATLACCRSPMSGTIDEIYSACGDMWCTQLVTNLKCHICVFAVFYRQNYITQPVGRMGQMEDLSCDRIT